MRSHSFGNIFVSRIQRGRRFGWRIRTIGLAGVLSKLFQSAIFAHNDARPFLCLLLFILFIPLEISKHPPLHFEIGFCQQLVYLSWFWELRQLIQSKVLEKLPRRPVEQRTSRCRSSADDRYEVSLQQRADHIICIYSADQFDFRFCHRLFIGNHSKALER